MTQLELNFTPPHTAPQYEETPMIRQWKHLRRQVPEGTLLFYRLGDFYEMFFDDAKRAAPILDLALIRHGGALFCGVPYHAVDAYIAKAVRAGYKVAICEEMEDAASARRGIIRREVVRTVSEE